MIVKENFAFIKFFLKIIKITFTIIKLTDRMTHVNKQTTIRRQKMFKVGDVVKYADKWCADYERDCRFVVLEVFDKGLKPIKIGSLTTKCSFGYVEMVEPEMIEIA